MSAALIIAELRRQVDELRQEIVLLKMQLEIRENELAMLRAK